MGPNLKWQYGIVIALSGLMWVHLRTALKIETVFYSETHQAPGQMMPQVTLAERMGRKREYTSSWTCRF